MSCGQACKGEGNEVEEGGPRWKCMGLVPCVKSRVMVGNGAEADRLAMVDK